MLREKCDGDRRRPGEIKKKTAARKKTETSSLDHTLSGRISLPKLLTFGYGKTKY